AAVRRLPRSRRAAAGGGVAKGWAHCPPFAQRLAVAVMRGPPDVLSKMESAKDSTMILEIAQIDVKPGMEAEFEAGVKKAGPLFKRAKGCKGMTLQKSHENPARYRLFVQWE